MAPWQPRAAICLHEDYDAQGLYAYELNRHPRHHIAEHCLKHAERFLSRDPRRVIEGRAARHAIIRPRRIPMFGNLPEAVALYHAGTSCTLTFETPSEHSLATRTLAHTRLVEAACKYFKDPVIP